MATVHTPDSPTYHDDASTTSQAGARRGTGLAASGISVFRTRTRVVAGLWWIFAAIGMLITWLGFNRPSLFDVLDRLSAGRPVVCHGLYRSRSFRTAARRSGSVHMGALRNRLGSVALFSLLLSLVMIAWIRFSTLAAALYVGNVAGARVHRRAPSPEVESVSGRVVRRRRRVRRADVRADRLVTASGAGRTR